MSKPTKLDMFRQALDDKIEAKTYNTWVLIWTLAGVNFAWQILVLRMIYRWVME